MIVPTHTSSRRAFTLIELLVTLSIVVVLAAILFPVIGTARSSSEQAKSAANLRTISTAAQMYFNSRDGDFFPTKYWDVYPSWGPSGKQGMRDYLGFEFSEVAIPKGSALYRDTILTVPALRNAYPLAATGVALHRCYSYNYYLNERDPSSSYNSRPSTERPQLPGGYHRIANVIHPSKMWMFTEGAISPDQAYFATSIADIRSAERMLFPYNGKQNFVFLDGHVETLTRDEFIAKDKERDFWGQVNP